MVRRGYDVRIVLAILRKLIDFRWWIRIVASG